MTIFQGALAAGPGRLKASSRAIGPIYYTKASTEFSWIEFRFRTTAWVPYIERLEWFDHLSPQHFEHSMPHSHVPFHKSRVHSVIPPIISCSPYVRHFKKHQSYGAGWLNLIESVPKNCQNWPLTRCQTDYLPSDVHATPARATIRAVVEMAALSGCDSVQLVNDLPLARGRGSQLSFRDHPFLGLVAAYDQYVIEDHT